MTLNIKDRLKEIAKIRVDKELIRMKEEKEEINRAAEIMVEVIIKWMETALERFDSSREICIHELMAPIELTSFLIARGSILVENEHAFAFAFNSEKFINDINHRLTNRQKLLDVVFNRVGEIVKSKHQLQLSKGEFPELQGEQGWGHDWCFRLEAVQP